MTRGGYTLVEILVALLLATISVGIAAGIVMGATDAVGVLGRRAQLREERSLMRAWLGQALAGAIVSPDSGRSFVGTVDRLSFRTSLWVPEGWLEPTPVEIAFDDGRLALEYGEAHRLTLLEELADASFEYLSELGAGSPWLPRWESLTAPPLAVRLHIVPQQGPPETVLFYLGER